MQFNITFKTIFEFILTKVVLCIQIRFVSTEKTTRIASRASCLLYLSAGWVRSFISPLPPPPPLPHLIPGTELYFISDSDHM